MPENTSRGWIGILPNSGRNPIAGFHIPDDVETGATYELAIAEFDDQGEAYEQRQIDEIREGISELHGRDIILAVFAHGWRHNASDDDDNLLAFKALLKQTADYENTVHAEAPRPVYGIYVSWRGKSLYGGTRWSSYVELATFWGRQNAARRVATGSVRELFGYLHRYRKRRLAAGGAPMLVIAGHSFGGLIVFSALEQSLIEAACAPQDHIVPGFADLVLLINPAFEASRFLALHRLSWKFRGRKRVQAPVFVCAYAENDEATRFAFPAGHFLSGKLQAVRGSLQRKCRARTIGNVPQLKTHDLSASGSTFDLAPCARVQQDNPFWVIEATSDVIDGHNGIWKPLFRDFLKSLLFAKTRTTKHGADTAARAAAIASSEKLSDMGATTASVTAAPSALA